MFKDVFGEPIALGDIVTYPQQYGHYLLVQVAEVVRFTDRSVVVQPLDGSPYYQYRQPHRTSVKRVDNITKTSYTRDEALALLAAALQRREQIKEQEENPNG